jgi:hypothetical protein
MQKPGRKSSQKEKKGEDDDGCNEHVDSPDRAFPRHEGPQKMKLGRRKAFAGMLHHPRTSSSMYGCAYLPDR